VLKTPFLFVLGFIVVFVIGGLTGVMFAAVPFDQQTTDSYFVVAHFHYVLFGGAVFPIFAGIYYWLPKMSGRTYNELLGQVSFWLVFVGFNLTFFPMHVSGLLGMPRRVYTYPHNLGWDAYNLLSTIGAFVLAAGILVIVVNVLWALARGAPALSDPWGGNTLEWSTTSPPQHYNFPVIPVVRSADPNWDLEDRRQDALRLERGELVLADGHQTLGTTVLEGEADEELHMPSESIWPLALAIAFSVVFAALLLDLYRLAIFGCLLVAGAIAGWHRPQRELQNQ
jgi:heme/copper-type cytochrome/quinol oxidase subunit 1